MEKGKVVKLLVSIFLAAIFIISYSTVFGTSAAPSTTVVTTTVGQTYFATGLANGVVTGFSPIMNISVKCSNNIETGSTFAEVSNGVATLEANNSVSTFYPIGQNLSVEAGNANTLQIYGYEYSILNASAQRCTTFTTGEVVELPSTVTLVVSKQKVSVPLQNSSREYLLRVNLSQSMNSIIPVKIAALLTQNGLIYGNLSVSKQV